MSPVSDHTFKLRLIMILTSLSMGVMSFFMPIYSKALKMNALEIAGLFSVISFMLIILRPFIGKLIDKVGNKPVLIAAIFIYALSYLIFSIADTPLLLYSARTLQGAGDALMAISIYAITLDTYHLVNISEGLGSINSARATGNIIGCALAFFILSRFSFFKGWKVLFTIFAMAALFSMYKVITEYREKSNQNNFSKFDLNKYSGRTFKLLIIVFISSLSSSIAGPILMVYLQDKITTNMFGLAMAFFPALIIDSLMAGKIGNITDNISRNKSMIIGTVLCAVSAIMITSLNSIIMFTVVWTINSISGRVYDLSESGLYAQLNSEKGNGEIFGVYTFVCNLGIMIGPLLGGFLYDTVSQKCPFYFSGIGMLITAILIPILLKEKVNV